MGWSGARPREAQWLLRDLPGASGRGAEGQALTSGTRPGGLRSVTHMQTHTLLLQPGVYLCPLLPTRIVGERKGYLFINSGPVLWAQRGGGLW